MMYYPKSIYRGEVVRRAIADYRAICRITLTESPEGFDCAIRALDETVDVQLIGYELSNYIIELLNSKGLI
jgi:hypothetical protein